MPCMIGVASRLSEQEIVREFFELFKTEWEFEQPGVDYEVVIRCAGDFGKQSNAKLVIFYGADSSATSSLRSVRTVCRRNRTLLFDNGRLPIYGPCLSFPDSSDNQLTDELTHESVTLRLTEREHQTVLWIGYDLWHE